MSKKWKLMSLLIPIMLILTGCGHVSVNDTSPWSMIAVGFANVIVFLSKLAGNSLAWGIVLATILVRTVVLPLYAKQIKSSEEMRKIQPQIKKIQEKYKGKKTQESQAKMSAEMNALYKENNVSPFAGCLPMFIQLPILWLFYSALTYLVPTSSMKTTVTGLQELHVDKILDPSVFNLPLTEPNIIFAILAAIGTFATSYLTQVGIDNSKEANPTQSSMKLMIYVMPLITFFVSYTLPAALGIHWVVGSLYTIIQTLIYRRTHIRVALDRRKMNKQNKKNKKNN